MNLYAVPHHESFLQAVLLVPPLGYRRLQLPGAGRLRERLRRAAALPSLPEPPINCCCLNNRRFPCDEGWTTSPLAHVK